MERRGRSIFAPYFTQHLVAALSKDVKAAPWEQAFQKWEDQPCGGGRWRGQSVRTSQPMALGVPIHLKY
jgi:hypothetical protein